MRRGWLCLLSSGAVVTTLAMAGSAAAAPNPWPQPRPLPAGPPGPAPEIARNTAPPALPAVPAFAVRSWDGVHAPRELRVAGAQLRGTRVTVGGYITWIYDCAGALDRPGATRAQIQREIDADPSQCERPKFYLGDARDTPQEQSLWVVDVPRPPFRRERDTLTAEELARWPAVPRLVVGAYVEVTGAFALASPHRERNPEGLVVFEAIDTTKAGPPPAKQLAATPVALPPLPARSPPVRAAVPPGAGESIRRANAGARALAARQYDAALAEYEAAVQAWSGNHLAWYGLAGTRSLRGDARGAADAAEHAAALVPEQPMYWLLLGRTRYEAVIAEATDRAVHAEGRRAEDITIDRAALDFAPALQALEMAIRLENQLWRAHYYVGRILGDLGDARASAEQLTEAIALHAWEPAPYLALGELYRRWGHRDEALAIAELGAATLPDAAELWYALGMVRLDRREHSDAIAAFSKALARKPDLRLAQLQRGRAYLRNRDFSRARDDLQAFVRAGGTGFDLEQARHLLVYLRR